MWLLELKMIHGASSTLLDSPGVDSGEMMTNVTGKCEPALVEKKPFFPSCVLRISLLLGTARDSHGKESAHATAMPSMDTSVLDDSGSF